MGLAPGRVEDFINGFANTLVVVESAKWRADFPGGVRMPDRDKPIPVVVVETEAVIGDKIPQGCPAFQLVYPAEKGVNLHLCFLLSVIVRSLLILFRPLLDPKPYGLDLVLLQGRLLDRHQLARSSD